MLAPLFARRQPLPSAALNDAGLDALSAACFTLAAFGLAQLLLEKRPRRYKGPMRRSHTYRPTPRQPERCKTCFDSLELGPHKPLPCGCGWRVADEKCCCTRRRDRFLEATCIWCRNGQHLTEGPPAVVLSGTGGPS